MRTKSAAEVKDYDDGHRNHDPEKSLSWLRILSAFCYKHNEPDIFGGMMGYISSPEDVKNSRKGIRLNELRRAERNLCDAVEAAVFNGATWAEIAHILGMTPEAAKKRFQ